MKLVGSTELSIRPFLIHLKELNRDFNGGQIMMLNLIAGHGNKNEIMLKERFESIHRQTNLKQVMYRHFDFHSECSENSQPMMDFILNDVWHS